MTGVFALSILALLHKISRLSPSQCLAGRSFQRAFAQIRREPLLSSVLVLEGCAFRKMLFLCSFLFRLWKNRTRPCCQSYRQPQNPLKIHNLTFKAVSRNFHQLFRAVLYVLLVFGVKNDAFVVCPEACFTVLDALCGLSPCDGELICAGTQRTTHPAWHRPDRTPSPTRCAYACVASLYSVSWTAKALLVIRTRFFVRICILSSASTCVDKNKYVTRQSRVWFSVQT